MTTLTTITPENIGELLAFHAANFGDARMEDEPKPDEPKPDEPKPDEPKPDEPKPDEPKEDELPEWARKELTKVRGEAANYRVQLRDAQANLDKAKTPEEFEAARTEMTQKIADLEHSLLKSTVARKYDLPDELASRLAGKDEAELVADAKVLQKLVASSTTPESLGGGLDPNDDSDGDMDPGALARKHGRRR